MTVYVGAKLYGFCGGLFGHEYGDKMIEALGRDWCVVREIDTGEPLFGRTHTPGEDIREHLEEYTRG